MVVKVVGFTCITSSYPMITNMDMESGIIGQKEVFFEIFRTKKDNLLRHNFDVMHIEIFIC